MLHWAGTCTGGIHIFSPVRKIKSFFNYLSIDVLTVVFVLACIFCSYEAPQASLLVTAALAILTAVKLIRGTARVTWLLWPLFGVPLFYLISAIAHGLTAYGLEMTVLWCVPAFCYMSISTRNAKRAVQTATILVPTILAGLSLLGSLNIPFIPNTFTPSGFNSDIRERLQSLLYYANVAGSLFSCGFFSLLSFKPSNRSMKLLKLVAGIVLLVALWLTKSRFSIAIFAVLLIAWLIITKSTHQKRTRRLLLYIAVLAVSLGAVYFIRPDILMQSSLALRLVYFQDAIKAIMSSPLLGLSPGGFGAKVYEQQSAIYYTNLVHNGFLQIAVDAGLPALSVFLVPLITSFSKKKAGSGFSVVLVMLLLHSLVDIDLSFTPVLMLLGSLIANQNHKTSPAQLVNLRKVKKFGGAAAVIGVAAVVLYLSAGETLYYVSQRFFDVDKEKALSLMHSANRLLNDDWRVTRDISKLLIETDRPEEAISTLEKSDNPLINKAVYYEILSYAYYAVSDFAGWTKATEEQLRVAPRRQEAYDLREIALKTNLAGLSPDVLEVEKNKLKALANEVNSTMNGLSKFFLDRDVQIKVNTDR